LHLLSSTALFGALALAGCGDSSDPNAGDDDDDRTEDTVEEPPDTGPAPDTIVGPDDTGSDGGEDGDAGGGGGGGGCERAGGDRPHAGGTPSSEPLANSAGLENIVTRIETIRSENGGSWPTDDSGEERTVELTGEDRIEVSNAVVTATSFKSDNFDAGQQNFWLQDSDRAVIAFLDMGEEIECPVVRVGDRVSFTVTGVKLFNGIPQISSVENYRRNTEAESDTVPVTNKTGEPITADDFAEIVRVSGELTENQGNCGGDATCFTLTHGAETVVYRATGSEKPSVGTCITFVGPANLFPGPLAEGGEKTPQLQTTNFDWRRTSPKEGDSCGPDEMFDGQIFTPASRAE